MTNEQNNYFQHESGHVILANIFKDVFDVEFVTVNEEISKKLDPLSKGGMKAKARKKNTELTINENDYLILIFLGGLCADDINENDEINDAFFEMSTWGPKLSKQKYSGDNYYINRHFQLIKESVNLDWETYIGSSIKLVYSILQNPIIRNTIKQLEAEIKKSINNTLQNEQINNTIAQSELSKWIDENYKSILSERKKLLSN